MQRPHDAASPMNARDIAGMFMRVAIAGGPQVGKTTLAQAIRGQGHTLRSTDDLIGGDWSKVSETVAGWFNRYGPWVVEGVAVPRALRKWLTARPGALAPCDLIIWLSTPHVELTPHQATMAKGVETVWRQIQPELDARGVTILEM